MSAIAEMLQKITETSSDYVKINMRILSLKVSDKLSKVLSGFLTLLILIVIFVFALTMISIGAAKWIGSLIDNEWAGFLIVGGIYVMLGIILMVMQKKVIKEPILNAIIKSIFTAEEKAEDEVEDMEDKIVDKLDGNGEKKKSFQVNSGSTITPLPAKKIEVPSRTAVKKSNPSIFSNFPSILKKTYQDWNAQDPFRQSASIAYYSIFSLPALLVIVVTSAGYLLGREAVTGQLSAQIGKMMGADTAKQIESMVAAASIDKKSFVATIIAIAVLIMGATGVFVQLQKTMNIIWNVKAKPKSKGKIWSFVKTRIMSFGLILSIGFLLLISLVITTTLAFFGDWMQGRMPGLAVIALQAINFIVSFGLITVLFALMFKFLPDVKIRWKDVWMGALLTSLLFSIGKLALGFYFGKTEPASVYGAAGSVVLIMLWISYSCMILLFGAEFTQQYSTAHGHKVVPVEHAEEESRDERSEAKGGKK
ncbi:MAG: YhjD/YihY/BrkB family envelope integrity protein [Chitinophagales bacterium]